MTCCEVPENSTKDWSTISLWNFIDLYKAEKASWNKQEVAEAAYAITMKLVWSAESLPHGFKDAADEYIASAKQYAEECLEAFNILPSKDTQADSAPIHSVIAEVVIPDLFYREYVELRFRQKKLIS